MLSPSVSVDMTPHSFLLALLAAQVTLVPSNPKIRGAIANALLCLGESFSAGHNARGDPSGPRMRLATSFHFGYHLEYHHRSDVPWWAHLVARKAGIGRRAGIGSLRKSEREPA